jgi:hypothetical protein
MSLRIMKKTAYIIIVIVLVLAMVFILLRGNEDSWIKDKRGVWIEHGNPKVIPAYVIEQQELLENVSQLYLEKKSEMNLSSQCLGLIEGYAIDIVHVPRTSEDDLTENQCKDFRNGTVSHFVELDNNGSIVRIV